MGQQKKYDRNYIQDLIDGKVQETQTLEYKGALPILSNGVGEYKRKLIKSITALANSQGGKLIVGMEEENDFPSIVTPIPTSKLTREQFDQIIHSNIMPAFSGYTITAVKWDENDGDTTYVYVIDIDQAETALQSMDHKYYKRINTTVSPMIDFEIRDVMNRNTTPRLDASLYLELDSTRANGAKDYQLFIRVLNTGTILANYVQTRIYVPSQFIGSSGWNTTLPSDYSLIEIGGIQYHWTTKLNEQGGIYHPVLPDSDSTGSTGFYFKREQGGFLGPLKEYNILVKIWADNAKMKSYEFNLLSLFDEAI